MREKNVLLKKSKRTENIFWKFILFIQIILVMQRLKITLLLIYKGIILAFQVNAHFIFVHSLQFWLQNSEKLKWILEIYNCCTFINYHWKHILVSIRTLKGTQFQVTMTMPGSQRTLLLDINVYNFENWLFSIVGSLQNWYAHFYFRKTDRIYLNKTLFNQEI